MSRLGQADLPALARGCALFGAGGGGDVGTALLAAGRAVRECGDVPVTRLADLDGDAVVLPLSGVGSPTLAQELLPSAEQPLRLRDEAERALGRPVAAVMPSEIGGANGVDAVGWAARLGVPLVDADGMGRAFPEVQMVAMYVAGRPVGVVLVCDVVGNTSTLRPVDGLWSERLVRALCVAGGGHALMADYILPAREARGAVIEGSVTRALVVGRSIEGAADPLAAVTTALGARTLLLTGKVTDVERRTGDGFVRGSVLVEGVAGDRGRQLRVEVQNENLVAFEDGHVLASVPDLISVVDADSAGAISTESLRYGYRVSVLAWPCHPLWRTARGLAVAGPRALGYDLDYVPVEEVRPDHA